MPYTTPKAVQAILKREDCGDLSPFIAAANRLVVNVCVPECYDDATLAEIEKWLAAHFYHISRPQTNEEEADNIRDRFDSKVDLGLKVTRYGQMALLMDYKGALSRIDYAAMNMGIPKPGLIWLGKKIRRTPPYGWPPGYQF